MTNTTRIEIDGLSYDMDIDGDVAWLTYIGKRGRPTKQYRLATYKNGKLGRLRGWLRLP